jgi:hypothetical protein
MGPVSEALISTRALPAVARLMFPWHIGLADVLRRLELVGELIIGVVVETTVLALGIFMVVTLACVGLL